MNLFRYILRYLRHYFSAHSLHGTHSPFVYTLLEKAIYNRSLFYAFEDIEDLRAELKCDNRIIHVTDLGAGSRVNKNIERKVSDIARHSLKSPKYSQLLFRLADYFNAGEVIELGTSLGITTAYLAGANSKSRVTTLEGCPQTAALARENFKKLSLENIELVVGNFNDTLEQVLATKPHVDFVFFDGNHQKLPTLHYFEECLKKAHDHSVFILDDIYWSQGMKEAWNEIKEHPQVAITIDLFFLGIVLFRKEQVKEHFRIRF